MSPRFAISSVLALVCLAGSAAAQVAPPPPPAGDPEPEFVPPPMPTPRQAPQRPQVNRPSNTTTTTDLPDFPYPPLWTFCGTEDPKVDDVCTFNDNLHFVALRPNPTISPGMLPEIQPVIVARRSRLEQMVIDHLEVMEDIDGGLIQEISIGDPASLQELLERVKPLTPPTNLTQELQNRGIISPTQAKFNNKIIGEYQRVYGEYLRRADSSNATDRFMQSMFRDSLIESQQAFNGMLHEARTRMDKVLSEVDDVPSDVAAKLRDLAISDLQIDPEKIPASAEQVKLAWRPLTTEQKVAFLTAVRNGRENPEVPPVPAVSVMHAGKRIVQKDPDSAKVLDNSENIKNLDKIREEAEQVEDDG